MSGLIAVVMPRSAVRALLAALCALLILALSGPVGGSPLVADLAHPFVAEGATDAEGPSLDLDLEDDADGVSNRHGSALAGMTQLRRDSAARRARGLLGPSPRGPPTLRR